ncbi:hypothetical protein [Variovorax sp. OK605]|uniref:hypothetical protein n=1 Tax=Variovorax sp. OK605 TaxID=1855317 RepID=UPI0011607712|nr:hypothetical protein [Variovorax sp. OK605]
MVASVLGIGTPALADSQIFNIFPGNAREPTIAISKERCAAPNFKGGRAFVARRGSGKSREACWDYLEDKNNKAKSIIVTCVLAGNILNGEATDECFRVTVDNFKDVTLP